jgi:two-component system LytT family response regulator
MSYTVIIVEDEKHQQEALTKMLEEFPEFQLYGIASSVADARHLIAAVKPDLVFLDVQLGQQKAFEILEDMDGIPFGIIFTTAFEEHAVRAFRFSAIDYLLKPVVREELETALEKFKHVREPAAQLLNIQNMLTNRHLVPAQQKMVLPTLTGFLYVPIKDIVRCESDNTYTTFFTIDKRKIVVSKTLKEIEHMLTESDYRFFRVHNSHLINLDCITEYFRGEGGIVKMSDGSQVDVSRRRKDEFLNQLKG